MEPRASSSSTTARRILAPALCCLAAGCGHGQGGQHATAPVARDSGGPPGRQVPIGGGRSLFGALRRLRQPDDRPGGRASVRTRSRGGRCNRASRGPRARARMTARARAPASPRRRPRRARRDGRPHAASEARAPRSALRARGPLLRRRAGPGARVRAAVSRRDGGARAAGHGGARRTATAARDLAPVAGAGDTQGAGDVGDQRRRSRRRRGDREPDRNARRHAAGRGQRRDGRTTSPARRGSWPVG